MHFLVKPDFIALHSWKRAICLSWVNERNQVVHCSSEEVQVLGSELLPQGFLSQPSMAASALQAQGWSRAVPCSGTEPGVPSTLQEEFMECSVAFAIGSYQVLSCLAASSLNPRARLEIPSLTENLL